MAKRERQKKKWKRGQTRELGEKKTQRATSRNGEERGTHSSAKKEGAAVCDKIDIEASRNVHGENVQRRDDKGERIYRILGLSWKAGKFLVN